MRQTSEYAEEVKKLLANLNEQQGNQEPEIEIPDTDVLNEPLEEEPGVTLHIHHFPDAIVIIKEPGEQINQQEQVIDSVASEVQPDSTPLTDQAQKPEQEALPPLNGKGRGARHTILTVSFYIFLMLSSLLLQSSLPFNSPTATVTIIPKSQQITVTSTVQLGRIIPPITLTQSQTAPTTGKGHQDARSAIGYITFYNGQLNSVTVPAGTILTGNDGVQIATDETAYIPAADLTANPPVIGHVTVSAHAVSTGASGNTQAYDINEPCSSSVVAKNLSHFTGGQDERDFRTVTKNDLNEVAASVKTTLARSMQAALQSQSESGEALITPTCTPTVTADHHVGEEAVQLKVTVSEICSAVAYNSQELKEKVTDLLTHHAVQTLGTGYSRLGDVQITMKQATVAPPHRLVFLSFVSQGTWVYALTSQEQQYIKELIAGKIKRNALQLLQSVPGIQSASIVWNENTKLPNDINAIHFVILVEA